MPVLSSARLLFDEMSKLQPFFICTTMDGYLVFLLLIDSVFCFLNMGLQDNAEASV